MDNLSTIINTFFLAFRKKNMNHNQIHNIACNYIQQFKINANRIDEVKQEVNEEAKPNVISL